MNIKNKLISLLLIVVAISFIACKTPPESRESKNAKIAQPDNKNFQLRDIKDIKNELIRERGHLFYSKEFNEAERLEEAMKQSFSKKKAIEGNEIALKVLERYKTIIRETRGKKEKTNYLKENIEKYLNDAEANEAYIWIPLEIDEVNNLYFEATRKYKNYDLDNALDMYSKAFNRAQQAAKNAKEAKALKETDERMYKQLKALEAASNLPIYSNNKLIKPSPWNGRAFIKERNSHLNLLNTNKDTYLLGEAEISIPIVLAYEEKVEIAKNSKPQEQFKTLELIERSRTLWEKGVEAKNVKNFRLANELFLESARYLEAYQSNASSELYVIKIGNTLWGISKKLYNDPYLWPKIWFANRQKIQNPDLIHSNWKIIIPAK
ncbi:LysM peptidoglycan-binding domain-containing protein [Borreliella burgdorferi]|uniref:LysM peptidoglycan-binding domain-containing protein n=1 Tax=Borreliella burgdorferi TaxID=139 RepID=UPI000BC2F4CF|nr:LysM peptidoglycan-binding domain-containing protein [Borreliella burgdorferi]ATH09885.1 LysM peptidoglycan-binding domain-containing protein [Borreliella burgdorferi]MCD2418033.1 LysM peptidoglycan-binding domain-containing protein [Borreliella burgdorferi]MCD2419957.1 LysM peptidoglycan-binding domain-containing protein [Borreliella burgdorferi]PRQ98285.1 LysM peptidoglycan-binding domain-containing protein [Borreliella burgdorferi]PRR38847.1 LysM peptidoglycan-binding domain-containing p